MFYIHNYFQAFVIGACIGSFLNVKTDQFLKNYGGLRKIKKILFQKAQIQSSLDIDIKFEKSLRNHLVRVKFRLLRKYSTNSGQMWKAWKPRQRLAARLGESHTLSGCRVHRSQDSATAAKDRSSRIPAAAEQQQQPKLQTEVTWP